MVTAGSVRNIKPPGGNVKEKNKKGLVKRP
jgi:hypothetical protein